MRDFGDDVLKGTAKYYSKYRATYPQEIFDDIAKNFKLDGNGRLLDLGCGTGELATPMANYFKKVLAVDLDDQLLELGAEKAQRLDINNIRWQKII
jgi:cyclopropane fatty-acyl-phospholipid synthase-like methyltransferase